MVLGIKLVSCKSNMCFLLQSHPSSQGQVHFHLSHWVAAAIGLKHL